MNKEQLKAEWERRSDWIRAYKIIDADKIFSFFADHYDRQIEELKGECGIWEGKWDDLKKLYDEETHKLKESNKALREKVDADLWDENDNMTEEVSKLQAENEQLKAEMINFSLRAERSFQHASIFRSAWKDEKQKNAGQLDAGLLEIELRHAKKHLASCEKALEDANNNCDAWREKAAERMNELEAIKKTGISWPTEEELEKLAVAKKAADVKLYDFTYGANVAYRILKERFTKNSKENNG